MPWIIKYNHKIKKNTINTKKYKQIKQKWSKTPLKKTPPSPCAYFLIALAPMWHNHVKQITVVNGMSSMYSAKTSLCIIFEGTANFDQKFGVFRTKCYISNSFSHAAKGSAREGSKTTTRNQSMNGILLKQVIYPEALKFT